MADKNLSRQRRINNEQLSRQQNETVSAAVAPLLNESEEFNLPIAFFCECSDPDCQQRLKLTLEEFRLAHQYKDQFIVCPGHQQQDIEKVIDQSSRFVTVEKFALNP